MMEAMRLGHRDNQQLLVVISAFSKIDVSSKAILSVSSSALLTRNNFSSAIRACVQTSNTRTHVGINSHTSEENSSSSDSDF